jgi:hypothetical protein
MPKLSEILAGLQIFAKYDPDDEISWADYEIYAGDSNIEYSKEDIAILEANGWSLESAYGCWWHLDV